MFLRDIVAVLWLALSTFVGLIVGGLTDDWNVGMLAFTGTLLAWYSVETRKLRLLSNESNRVNSHPGLTLRYIRENPDGGGDWCLLLTNTGKGVVLNPEIEIMEDSRGFIIDLNGVNAISPGDYIRVYLTKDGKKLDNKLLMSFDRNPLHVRLSCGSVLNSRNQMTTEVELKNPPGSKIIFTNWL